MSDPAPNLGSALPLKRASVRPLRSSGPNGTLGANSNAPAKASSNVSPNSSPPSGVVRRLSVNELKAGRDFNQLINLDSAASLSSKDNSRPSSGNFWGGGGSTNSGTISVPGAMAKPGLASSELTNSDLANRDKPSPLSPEEAKAALAAQTAQGRYYGRKTPKAETLLRNKSSSLTEEEKIGQLKKIKKAAEDYEGLLMKEMIKSVRQSPLVKTAGSDTYSEIAEKPFTAALTAAGGLGLSERVVTDVARQQGLLSALEEHPEIMGPNYRPKISPNRLRKAPTLPKGAGATNSETTSQMTNSSSSTSSVNVPAMAG